MFTLQYPSAPLPNAPPHPHPRTPPAQPNPSVALPESEEKASDAGGVGVCGLSPGTNNLLNNPMFHPGVDAASLLAMMEAEMKAEAATDAGAGAGAGAKGSDADDDGGTSSSGADGGGTSSSDADDGENGHTDGAGSGSGKDDADVSEVVGWISTEISTDMSTDLGVPKAPPSMPNPTAGVASVSRSSRAIREVSPDPVAPVGPRSSSVLFKQRLNGPPQRLLLSVGKGGQGGGAGGDGDGERMGEGLVQAVRGLAVPTLCAAVGLQGADGGGDAATTPPPALHSFALGRSGGDDGSGGSGGSDGGGGGGSGGGGGGESHGIIGASLTTWHRHPYPTRSSDADASESDGAGVGAGRAGRAGDEAGDEARAYLVLPQSVCVVAKVPTGQAQAQSHNILRAELIRRLPQLQNGDQGGHGVTLVSGGGVTDGVDGVDGIDVNNGTKRAGVPPDLSYLCGSLRYGLGG